MEIVDAWGKRKENMDALHLHVLVCMYVGII